MMTTTVGCLSVDLSLVTAPDEIYGRPAALEKKGVIIVKTLTVDDRGTTSPHTQDEKKKKTRDNTERIPYGSHMMPSSTAKWLMMCVLPVVSSSQCAL